MVLGDVGRLAAVLLERGDDLVDDHLLVRVAPSLERLAPENPPLLGGAQEVLVVADQHPERIGGRPRAGFEPIPARRLLVEQHDEWLIMGRALPAAGLHDPSPGRGLGHHPRRAAEGGHGRFERRRDKHRTTVEAARLEIVGRCVIISVVGTVVMFAAPPAWQPLGCALVAIGVMSTLGQLFVLPQHVMAWETFHDRQIPISTANIDHVVVGPTGVWVIETRSFGGCGRVQYGDLRVNGRRRKGGPGG